MVDTIDTRSWFFILFDRAVFVFLYWAVVCDRSDSIGSPVFCAVLKPRLPRRIDWYSGVGGRIDCTSMGIANMCFMSIGKCK